MKLIIVLFIIASLAAVGYSQKGRKEPSLSQTASLEETQTWLTMALKRYPKYTFKSKTSNQTESFHISEITFDKCVISYRYAKVVEPASHMGGMDVVTLIKYDFADINPNAITVKPSTVRDIDRVQLNTLADKNSIELVENPYDWAHRTEHSSTTNIDVRSESSEKLVVALKRMAQLCQAPTTTR